MLSIVGVQFWLYGTIYIVHIIAELNYTYIGRNHRGESIEEVGMTACM
jgi:hypothetical protein